MLSIPNPRKSSDHLSLRKPGGLWERIAYQLRLMRRAQHKKHTHGYRESRYRNLFDGVPIALYLSAPDGTILDANPAMVELLAFPSRESLLQLNASDLFVDPKVRNSQIARLEREGTVRDYPLQLRRRDGELIWVLDQARAVRDSRGRVMFYEGSLKDITREKVAREELQRTNETLRALIEASPLAIFSLDADRNVLSWNPAAERTFGWRQDELLGMPLPPVVPEDQQGEFHLLHRRLLRGHSLHEVEVIWRRRDGKLIQVAISAGPLHDASGSVAGTIAVLADVTERKQAEETRKRLAEILQATPDLVGMFTVDGVGIYLNKAGMDLLGLSPESVPSPQPIWDYHPEPYRSLVRDEILPAAIRDGSWSGEVAFSSCDGRDVPTSMVMIAHHADDGRVDHLSVIARDLTEQKVLEGRLRHAQTMEAIGRLAGGIAHDFNNLLTSIIGHCELVLRHLRDEQARSDIEEIKAAGERAADLTSQLLAFGRRQVLQPRLLDLNELVAGLEGRLKEMAGPRVKLTIDFDKKLRTVKADPIQIEAIILSLAENSCEAMPDGGRLAIATAHTKLTIDEAQQLDISQPGDYASLSITDTGTGMDDGTRSRIFEPFFSTKKEVKGTGLGLATVFGIVKQSGGDIFVESEPGSGTTVRVYIPTVAEEPAAATAATGVAAEPGAATGGTVLLVEDEPAVRSLAVRVLKARGYTVLEAHDGAEALQLQEFHDGPIDILITDVVMPRLGGPELAERLLETRPDARVIFMSGYTDNTTVRDMMADKDVHFLQKPFSLSALAELTRQVLGSTRAGSSQASTP
jgi:PAS domain S-box-containing protein